MLQRVLAAGIRFHIVGVPPPLLLSLFSAPADKWLALWVLTLFVLVSILLGPAIDPSQPVDGVLTGIALIVGSCASGLAGE